MAERGNWGTKAPELLASAEPVRQDWQGDPLHEGYLEHHESFRVARESLAGLAEADRAFGGDGTVRGDDDASRMAATLLWLERNVVNLAGDAAKGDRNAARAILDYFPAPHIPNDVEGRG